MITEGQRGKEGVSAGGRLMAGQGGQQQQEGFRRKGEEPVDAGRADSTLTVPWKLSRAQLSKAFPFP